MNILLINGHITSDSGDEFNSWLEQILMSLETRGHHVGKYSLCAMDLKTCVGCWDCWVKTPGRCSVSDDTAELRRAVLESDMVLFASPLIMGFTSSLLKKLQDKMIPLLSPYFRNVDGEIHHRPRYSRMPGIGLLLSGEDDSTEEDISITVSLFKRFAVNFDSRLMIHAVNDKPADEVAHEIDML